jgi:hypothetical protein
MRVTVSEAAAHCGYASRTVIYRLHRDGRLRDYEAGRQGRSMLLETHPPGRCSLRAHIAACVQLRYDSPLAQRRPPAEPLVELGDAELGACCDEVMAGLDAVELGPDWEEISEAANSMVDCKAWGPPPWAADQWATLAVVLELAQEAAAGGCCCPSSPCMTSSSGPPSHPNRKPTTCAHSASPGPPSQLA